MNIEHTPGPWKTHAPEPETIFIESEDGCWIATCYQQRDPRDFGRPVDHTDPIQDANAQLISAAPDLKEALDDALYYMEHGNGDRDWIMDQAEAALAKARGEE